MKWYVVSHVATVYLDRQLVYDSFKLITALFIMCCQEINLVIMRARVRVSSVKVRVLCQEGVCVGGSSSLIGQKCKMADGKQSSDWTIIQDGNSACDWMRIQDGGWKGSHLIGQ